MYSISYLPFMGVRKYMYADNEIESRQTNPHRRKPVAKDRQQRAAIVEGRARARLRTEMLERKAKTDQLIQAQVCHMIR